jgi:hypothetical protein
LGDGLSFWVGVEVGARAMTMVMMITNPSGSARYANISAYRDHHSIRSDIIANLRGDCCQDAGPHPLRHAAKKERIINKH